MRPRERRRVSTKPPLLKSFQFGQPSGSNAVCTLHGLRLGHIAIRLTVASPRYRRPNRPGVVRRGGAPLRAELTAVQERRTRGRGAEPLRAKRVPKKPKKLKIYVISKILRLKAPAGATT